MHGLRRYLLAMTLLTGGLLCGSLTGLALARSAKVHGSGPRPEGSEVVAREAVAGAGARRLGSVGILPPGHPAADCGRWGLRGIDTCRAREGVGPLVLPRNWSHLSTDARLLVLIDLERVNRGLAPIPAIVAPLNQLAQAGAAAGRDPAFPADCNCAGGAIWASADPPSVFEADELWMYDDAGSQWGHRDNILMGGRALVGGAGATRDNWTFEMLDGFRYATSAVTFRWAWELRYFTRTPGPEPVH